MNHWTEPLLLLRRWGFLAIRAGWVDCDFYRMPEGDMAAVNARRGAYMGQYSRAELTAGTSFSGKDFN